MLAAAAFNFKRVMNALVRLILEWLRWLMVGQINEYCLPVYTIDSNYQHTTAFLRVDYLYSRVIILRKNATILRILHLIH